MLKGPSINPQISSILAQTGHTDCISVVDAGYPIPTDAQRVDLAWTKGKPGWLEVCEFIKSQLVIQKIYLAHEIVSGNPAIHQKFLEIFEGTPIEYIPHAEIKAKTHAARGVIRTGEYSSFSNCIFEAGVSF